jgi:HEAT repeat protein
MEPLRIRLAAAAVLCVVVGAPAFSQTRTTSVDPIPAVERFVQGTGLRVRLTVAKASVAAFEDPGFVVHLDNVGKTPLPLNSHVLPNLYIYDERGQPARSFVSLYENYALTYIKNASVLAPGQTLSQPMRPEHHVGHELGRLDSYMASDRLLLRGGKYTARFVYVNASGFPYRYDPRDIPGMWEGRLESEPVTFTVQPGAEAELSAMEQRYRTRVQEDTRPRTVAEAEVALASNDQRAFADATDLLLRLRSTSPMTALRRLLTDPEPWKRSAAARAILAMDDERVRDVALSLIDGPDGAVRAQARGWLAFRCTTAMLPLLESRVAPLAGWETLLGKCGSAETFLTLRRQLDSTDERIRREAMYAIAELTFQGYEFSSRATPDEVDRWYESHKGESRRMWAERLIRENQPRAWAAADYLRRMSDPQVLPALRHATSSPNAAVRVIAARGIAQFNRAEGVALLKRELVNRDPWVCTSAVTALNELTDHHYTFDFLIPAEREKAIAAYAAIN